MCGYGRTLNEMKNLQRHMLTCGTLQCDVSEIERLRSCVAELEDVKKKQQLEIDHLQKKLIDALDENRTKRHKTVINNNTTNNTTNNMTINVTYAFGDEPQLSAKDVYSVMNSCFNMIDIVPEYLKQKHFSSLETSNIRIDDFGGDNIETVRKDAKTGQLQWKRERKNATKFCEDLAMTTVSELNDKYHAHRDIPWRAFCNNRFGNNPDPELKKQNPERQLGIGVKNMIIENS